MSHIETENQKPQRENSGTNSKLHSVFLFLKEEKGLTLYRSEHRNAVRIMTDEGSILLDPMSSQFKKYVRAIYYNDKTILLRTADIDELVLHIDSLCAYFGSKVVLYPRVAYHEGAIYIALDQYKFVKVTTEGYEITNTCPAHILMSPLALPLPEPSAHPRFDFTNLAVLFHLDLSDVAKVAAFCLSAFVPPEKMAYPILSISGEQGAAKSTLTKCVKGFLDPSRAMARNFPKKEQDLAITAQGESVLAYDNLSGISNQMSDALCRLSTGGEFTTRKLYTDNEEVILTAKVPVILNGIPDLANRGDLADRTYAVRMSRIPQEERLPADEVNGILEALAPDLLARLFQGLSLGLANANTIEIPNLPRMADAAKWAVAAETALGFEAGTMLAAFEENTADLFTQVAQADELALGIIEFIHQEEEWQGTTTEFLNALRRFHIAENPKWMPKTPVSLGNHLRRVITALNENGIRFDERRTGVQRIISFSSSNPQTQIEPDDAVW